MLPPKFNSYLVVSKWPFFGPFEPCFTFCASRGDDDVDADDFDGDAMMTVMMVVVVVMMVVLMLMVMVKLVRQEDNSNWLAATNN